mmetsp:Transcript_13197/g.52888  ORF Transcript_13197/g.52888 Transcript_13197/m.52888 type:complete len:289 (+) Transcript_13197:344-1210(+)
MSRSLIAGTPSVQRLLRARRDAQEPARAARWQWRRRAAAPAREAPLGEPRREGRRAAQARAPEVRALRRRRRGPRQLRRRARLFGSAHGPPRKPEPTEQPRRLSVRRAERQLRPGARGGAREALAVCRSRQDAAEHPGPLGAQRVESTTRRRGPWEPRRLRDRLRPEGLRRGLCDCVVWCAGRRALCQAATVLSSVVLLYIEGKDEIGLCGTHRSSSSGYIWPVTCVRLMRSTAHRGEERVAADERDRFSGDIINGTSAFFITSAVTLPTILGELDLGRQRRCRGRRA